MLKKVRLSVYGKINLSLNVLGVRDGLHTLESVVASVSICDTITVRDRLDDKINLIFNADFQPQNNTVIRAVKALRKSFGDFGVDIVVDKRLPLSGGMGGSSADAAGVIAALTALFDFDKRGLDARSVCSAVGSDVLYMLKGGYAVMRGVGDEIEYIPCNRRLGLVYILGGGVDTAAVYGAFDRLGGGEPVDNARLLSDLMGGRELLCGNMLTRAAVSLCPEIERNLGALSALGLSGCMTGSGSTVYAVCSEPERAAAELVKRGFRAGAMSTRERGISFED